MKGALLVNLGSPNSTSVKDVKNYLDEFLMDKRVIDTPYLIRAFVVKGIILNTRPKKSAEAYKKIWWPEGSPLIVLSERLHKKVQKNSTIPVELAMRYGNPSIKSGIEKLAAKGVKEIFLIPLYPQFAMATTETITVLASKIVEKDFPNIKITDVPAFYNEPDYIEVLSNSIQQHSELIKPDHLLFSYHGVPERHIKKSDITKYIPHREPFIMIDNLVNATSDQFESDFVIDASNIFLKDGDDFIVFQAIISTIEKIHIPATDWF